MEEKKRERSGVSWRAILLALVLIPVNCYWITVVEVRWYTLDGTCLPLFITPIFTLFVLAVANLLVRRLSSRLALRQNELLVVYIMVVIASVMASHDLLQNLFGAIGHPHRMATPENKWQTLWFKYLPLDLFVTNKKVLEGFYLGSVNPFTPSILKYWLLPLSLWGGFVLVLIGTMLCMNVLIRKQWTENEKLVFPLVQLPIAMTGQDAGRKFYRDKMMWAGFTVAVLIGVINGLHMIYPSVPYLEAVKQYNLGQFVTQRPWNAINTDRGMNMSMYPFAVGLAYFIPLDLSFSCWFFYLARKFWSVLGAMMGWDAAANAGFPYFDQQSSGAWIALSLVIVWGSRKFLAEVWHKAWSKDVPIEEKTEAREYRTAFIGIAIGLILVAAFCSYIKLSPWVSIVFFGIYFLLSIAITRVRAELGTPHEIYFVNPQQIMVSIFGLGGLGVANLTIISAMYWFNRGYRSHPMPNQLEAFKMSEGRSISTASMVFALSLAAVVGMLATYWANLQVTYSAGAQAKCTGFKSWVGSESFDRLTNWINAGVKPEFTKIM